MKTLALKKATKTNSRNKSSVRVVKKLRTSNAKDTFADKENTIKEFLKKVDSKKSKKAS